MSERPDKLLPPGMQYIKPPDNYTGPHRTMDWRGFYVKVGPGYSPFFFNELERIRQNIEACIIIVTGKGGSGKTYFAIRMAEIMDPKFTPDLQIPFGSEELLQLIGENSPLKRGQVIVVDESQWGMSSRDWYKDIQKDIMKQIEAIRSKGYIIFIVSLSMKNLDVIARNYVLTHLVHMRRRGEGIIYRFYMPPFAVEPYKERLGAVRLCMPGYENCNHSTCLTCRYSGLRKTMWNLRDQWTEEKKPICQNIRARYERKKRTHLELEAQKTEKKQKEKENELTKEALATIAEAEYPQLQQQKNKRIDADSLAHLLSERTGIYVSRTKSYAIRIILETWHPEWKPTRNTAQKR